MEVTEHLTVFDVRVLLYSADKHLFHKVKIIKIIQAIGNLKKKSPASQCSHLMQLFFAVPSLIFVQPNTWWNA